MCSLPTAFHHDDDEFQHDFDDLADDFHVHNDKDVFLMRMMMIFRMHFQQKFSTLWKCINDFKCDNNCRTLISNPTRTAGSSDGKHIIGSIHPLQLYCWLANFKNYLYLCACVYLYLCTCVFVLKNYLYLYFKTICICMPVCLYLCACVYLYFKSICIWKVFVFGAR